MTAATVENHAPELTLISRLSGSMSVLLAILSYASWITALPVLAPFKAMPTVPFLLAGLATLALQKKVIQAPVYVSGLLSAAALVLISGHDLLTLLATSSADSLQCVSAGFSFSVLNSLAANDALSFLLIGGALLLADVPTLSRLRISDCFTLTATGLSIMTLLGVIFGIPGFCVFISCLRISFLEGVAIAFLSIGVLFIRPNQGLSSVIASGTAGGAMARRLLPVMLFIPLILGWLRMEGQRANLYGSEIGLTVMVALLVVTFVAVIVWNSWSLNRIDAARLRAIKEMEAEIARRKEVEQRFKEFYSSVSHELKSPITSIQGALQLIDQSSDPEAVTALIGTADISCDRLIRLINDLLDVKQIEEGRLELRLTETDTLELASLAVDGLEPIARSAGVEISMVMDALGFVHVDQDRMLQVLTNLLSNAIKYSSSGSTVVVKVSQAQEDNMIRFSVKDDGPGIAADQQHKVFGKFERIDAADGKVRKGTGLGLAISKGIVEEHGGKIGFITEVQKGSEFWFELKSSPTLESTIS